MRQKPRLNPKIMRTIAMVCVLIGIVGGAIAAVQFMGLRALASDGVVVEGVVIRKEVISSTRGKKVHKVIVDYDGPDGVEYRKTFKVPSSMASSIESNGPITLRVDQNDGTKSMVDKGKVTLPETAMAGPACLIFAIILFVAAKRVEKTAGGEQPAGDPVA